MTYLLIAQNEVDLALLRQGAIFRLLGSPLDHEIEQELTFTRGPASAKRKVGYGLKGSIAAAKQACGTSIKEVLVRNCAADARSWFSQLSATIQASLEHGPLIVLVSHVRPHCLNPLVDSGWESVLAMLILAFPEVRWLFGTIQGYADAAKIGELDSFRSAHGIGNLFGPDQTPLFDETGLRDWVRQRAADKDSETKRDAKYLARRTKVAIALDEETPYAHLHAYTAYRFGFRATAVNTAALADQFLGDPRKNDDLSLVFEDIYVNFADGIKGMSWLDVDPEDNKGRSTQWPRLAKADHRIFVTSGQRLKGDGPKWICNKAYLSQQKTDGKHIATLFKPYAGIFRLWEGAGLVRKLRGPDFVGKVRRGVAEDFIWPPPRDSYTDGDSHGHSSPGVLLIIAESLIERAEGLQKEGVHTVQEAVRGAVLANDALELLGGRTPTIAMEALRLKHHLELLAECQFSGVEHHVCIRERITEIRHDIKAISYWFGPKKRRIAGWNAEMQIVTDLVRILREHGHFDEEQYCMTNIRRAMRKIWLHEARPWSYAGYPLRWYVEILLDRPIHFIGALSLWTAALFWFFMQHGQQQGGQEPMPGHGWEASIAETMTTFFQTQPPQGIGWLAMLVSSAAILFGFVHLGIFISHLYTQVSRR